MTAQASTFGRRAVQFLLIITLVFNGLGAFATPVSQANRASAEHLTQALMALNGQYQAATPAGKAALYLQIRAVAAKRQQLLSALVQTSPGEVLRVAIPGGIAATLPAFVQTLVEQETDTQGELEVMYEDAQNGATLHHFLKTGSQRLELKFAANAPTNLLTGSIVHVHGTRLGGTLALACCTGGGTGSFQVVKAAGLSGTFGGQNVLIILVNFKDEATQPFTTTAVNSLVFGTGMSNVNGFYQSSSYGQTWLTGDVAGWYTIPVSYTNCSTSSIETYAQQAAQNAGYVLSNYSRFVYAFPTNTGCSWSGWSYVGGNPSNSWINNNMSLRVVAHELGHAFGLYHSHSLTCTSGGAQVPYSGNCSMTEYGDELDDMGSPYPMYFNASQKERLGWLNSGSSPPITTVSSSGSYTIAPYETQDSNPKALKILQSSNSNSYYYIESRQFIGDDEWAQTNAVYTSVLFHLSSPSDSNSNDILQMNPGNSYGWENPGLQQGSSYTDSSAGVTVAATAVNSTGATVQVTLAGATCTPANPTVSISPSQGPWVTAGTTVSFTVTVADNDSAACSSTSFNLGDAVPSGWSDQWNNSSLALTPGTSGSATLQVTSPVGTADGFYNFSASATNASAPTYTASASATYVISTAPTISINVSANPSSASSGQTVAVNATVLSGGSPDAGASVTVVVAPPGGRTQTMTGTTDSNGAVSLSYKLNKRAAKGTYQVQANSGSASAGTTFVVQ